MSDLVAIAYEDLPTAQQVASNLGEAVKGHDIELDDLVIVERKDDGWPLLGGSGRGSGLFPALSGVSGGQQASLPAARCGSRKPRACGRTQLNRPASTFKPDRRFPSKRAGGMESR
jgi:hypothetical protein